MAAVQVTVNGNKGGSVEVYRNNLYITTVTTSQIINFNMGDSFLFDAIPASGYVFQKFCGDSGCTVTTTSNPFSGTITVELGQVNAYFITGVLVTVYNHVGGSVDAYRNNVLVANVTSTQLVPYNIGDTFRFEAKASSGYAFQKFCGDTACTITTTSSSFSGTIDTIPGQVIAHFIKAVIINVGIVAGKGDVVVHKNGVAIITIGNVDGMVPVVFQEDDRAEFYAYPYTPSGYSYDKTCFTSSNPLYSPYTCVIGNPASSTIVDGDSKVEIFFKGTPATYSVYKAGGDGWVDVFINLKFAGTVTSSTAFSCFVNDSIKAIASLPTGSNYKFDVFCQKPDCSTGSSSSNMIDVNIASTSDSLYAYFTQRTVSVVMDVSPSGAGTVLTNNANLNVIQVYAGTSVTWKAVPATGYKFDHFALDGLTSTSNPATFNVGYSGTLTAVFVPDTTSLNVIVQSGAGKVDVYVNNGYVVSITGGGTIYCYYTDIVKLVAMPASGYAFNKFCPNTSCSPSTTSNPVQLTKITPGSSIYAYFSSVSPSPTYYTISTAVSPAGSGTIQTNGQNLSSIKVQSGTTITFKAIPASGWAFDHFVLPNGATPNLNPVSYTPTLSGTVTAVFVKTTAPPPPPPPSYTVSTAVSPVGSGTVQINGQNISSIKVQSGTVITFKAIPASGWAFNHFILPNGATPNWNPVNYIPTLSGTVTAVFVKTTVPSYTVSTAVSPVGSGTVQINGQNISSIKVQSGTVITFKAIPASGWAFNHFILPNGATPNWNPVNYIPTLSGRVIAVFTKI